MPVLVAEEAILITFLSCILCGKLCSSGVQILVNADRERSWVPNGVLCLLGEASLDSEINEWYETRVSEKGILYYI